MQEMEIRRNVLLQAIDTRAIAELQIFSRYVIKIVGYVPEILGLLMLAWASAMQLMSKNSTIKLLTLHSWYRLFGQKIKYFL